MNKPIYIKLKKGKIHRTVPYTHGDFDKGEVAFYVDLDENRNKLGIEILDYEEIDIDGKIINPKRRVNYGK